MKIAYNYINPNTLNDNKVDKQPKPSEPSKPLKSIESYDERTARIESIKNQIQNGTYKLDMKATAQAIKNELFNLNESHDI